MSAIVRLAAAVARQVCDDDSDEAEEMRSLAIAARRECDRLRAEVTDLLLEADAKQHFATRALRAEERLERLRREVEALRDSLRTNAAWGHSEDVDAVWHELDAILRGES